MTPTLTAAARVSGTIKALDRPSPENSTWTICPETLIALRDAAGDQCDELDLEHVEAIALAVEARILAAIQPDPEPKPVAKVDELATIIGMLARHVPDDKQIKGKALDYLRRHGLQGSPLRDDATPPSAVDEAANPELAINRKLGISDSAGTVSVEEAARPMSDIPEDGTWALLYPGYYGPVTACVMNGEWSLFDEAEKPHVTHWVEIQPALRALAGEGGR